MSTDNFMGQPMRGDKAMVVGLQHQTELNGRVVNVLSDPFESKAIHNTLATVTKPLILSKVDLGRESSAWDGCEGDVIATRNLIKMPPDGLKAKQREKAVDA